MTIRSWISATLLGLSLVISPVGDAAWAETLRVVKKGTVETLDVPMNRAIVVESEQPFAELSIANAGIADISSLSDRTIYVLGKAPGLTTLTLFDGAGNLLANVRVRVSPDVSEFKERLRQILPEEPIEVRTANDGIVLSGTVSSSAKLSRALELAERYAPDRVSNLMSVGGVQQVMLKVRFAEMNRSVAKSLTASLGFGGSDVTGGFNTLNNQLSLNNALNNNIPAIQTNTGAILFGFGAGSTQVRLLLEALESKGLARSLAEPNLSALSGQQATFLAGGEVPIPVPQDEGVITIEYKAFGVEIDFIPRVVDGDLINLEMATAVSSIDQSSDFTLNGDPVPSFITRRATTTIELRDGESFAIAGLIQDDFADLSNQVPWLGDVPVLGALFRSANYQREQSELVVIITAHLVSPTRGEALALPTDRVKPPSEFDLFVNGQVARTQRAGSGGASEVAKQDFGSSYGYVLD
ncbi:MULTISPECIES: type II and III secretion system protein family protein [unclassified Ruegeria]|uniref:type II and III secretion system protein family protein n=1 Tax=unclassified Ruegeria TaxID=2625375 RepID=UPI001489BA0C|nr:MULTISPECIES: type II and III secretion system protein family protein [unclassified Ruegeria]NOD35189.1 general secretion pathway protein [Ruegeria sp. HKCCD7296]NOD46845.1 general secretion pathway protein [Ruegeria sp. HKCCD5849]NOD51168.1 general secretion pathway protein [Ruegeria sp. HKCCD5851]NOD67987.1 general secretion pathway protein [Ruegeria sp. HKCCD7303]NOE33589.1 general secretion pathway protein [Ruegeria sp. HKCCD7318]